jgi:hypothetical protein
MLFPSGAALHAEMSSQLRLPLFHVRGLHCQPLSPGEGWSGDLAWPTAAIPHAIKQPTSTGEPGINILALLQGIPCSSAYLSCGLDCSLML